MAYGIGTIAPLLLVSNLEQSRFFYENLLKLRAVYLSQEQGIICYAWDADEAIILRIRQGTNEELEKLDAPLGQGVEFVLDIGRGYQYAMAPFEKENYPYQWDGGLVALDPDGYKWQLVG